MYQVQYDSFQKWTHVYPWDKWRHLGPQLEPATSHIASKSHTHYPETFLQYLKRTVACADRMCSAELEFSGPGALITNLGGFLSMNSFLRVAFNSNTSFMRTFGRDWRSHWLWYGRRRFNCCILIRTKCLAEINYFLFFKSLSSLIWWSLWEKAMRNLVLGFGRAGRFVFLRKMGW